MRNIHKYAVKMFSAIPKTFGIQLNSSSIFFWNMSTAGAAPNGNHIYLYMPMDKKMLLNMMIFHLILDCGN